jgi:hypothetical protein
MIFPSAPQFTAKSVHMRLEQYFFPILMHSEYPDEKTEQFERRRTHACVVRLLGVLSDLRNGDAKDSAEAKAQFNHGREFCLDNRTMVLYYFANNSGFVSSGSLIKHMLLLN